MRATSDEHIIGEEPTDYDAPAVLDVEKLVGLFTNWGGSGGPGGMSMSLSFSD